MAQNGTGQIFRMAGTTPSNQGDHCRLQVDMCSYVSATNVRRTSQFTLSLGDVVDEFFGKSGIAGLRQRL
jgi:hypothetical protein